MTLTLTLKTGRDRQISHGHPWIFSGAVEREPKQAAPGSTVQVLAASGKPLGWAAYSPASQIRARMWTTDLSRPIDHAHFKRVIHQAIGARMTACRERGWRFEDANLRLLHGESDGLPGVICDVYRLHGDDERRDWLVVQITSAGGERWREAIVDALVAETGVACVYERSDSDVRSLEGMTPRSGLVRGDDVPLPTAHYWIDEQGTRLHIDIVGGHKTGFYLDQRDNRDGVRRHAKGARVLNCFCYTGGFSLAALSGGGARSTLD